MYLKKFSVNTTNIWPMANTTTGGQLVTEFNIRSQDSVYTAESVQYMIGPSYTHGEQDFFVSLLGNTGEYFPNSSTSSSILEIQGGRAIVNGHFIESLTSITIDMVAINTGLVAQGETPLTGNLSIGLKVFYSTEETMSGAIEPEESTGTNQVYGGIQVVILPTDQFLLPTSKFVQGSTEIDCGLPENEGYVTAHLLLATFNYSAGSISNIINNYPGKCQMLPASRVGQIDSLISDEYIRKTGLNSKRLYAFAGKGINPSTGLDTWCDVTGSLMLWDTMTPEYVTEDPGLSKATFQYNPTSGVTQLIIPHKQIDTSSVGYNMETSTGTQQYFAPVVLNLPLADFGKGTPGTVNGDYTKSIKAIESRIAEFYQLTNGHQVGFIDSLDFAKGTEDPDLPPINMSTYQDPENPGTYIPAWNVGDYILVAKDNTIISNLNDTLNLTPPSTLYVLLPGYVRSINAGTTEHPTGVELDRIFLDVNNSPTSAPWLETDWWDFDANKYRGVVGKDYFTMEYTIYEETAQGTVPITTSYYFTVKTNTERLAYSEPIQLTGQLPFAEETMTGGFLNVPESATDYGYVYLDDEGHLRLLDYALLRSGTLAYQLGEDFTVPTGLTVSEIQAYLDEYVNQRIAFPNANQSQNSETPNIININITITGDDEGGTLDIYDIDSRFGTSVCINIYGTAGSNVTINISDCAKVMIGSKIEGTPIINLYRSCLYYNASILDYLNTIRDLTLWYAVIDPTEDPDLIVEGMTVRASTSSEYVSGISVSRNDYWSTEAVNDNHFDVALQSITFNSNGFIDGCGLLVRNNSTANVSVGKSIIHQEFELPEQGMSLQYPKSRLATNIIVTGSFIAAYTTEQPQGYMIQDTKFSIKTPAYTRSLDVQTGGAGELAVLVDAYNIVDLNNTDIDSWDPGTFHYFEGVTHLI